MLGGVLTNNFLSVQYLRGTKYIRNVVLQF